MTKNSNIYMSTLLGMQTNLFLTLHLLNLKEPRLNIWELNNL